MEERLNDLNETARRIRVSHWTVRRLIGDGHIRGVRVGRRILVSDSEISRVMREGAGPRAQSATA